MMRLYRRKGLTLAMPQAAVFAATGTLAVLTAAAGSSVALFRAGAAHDGARLIAT